MVPFYLLKLLLWIESNHFIPSKSGRDMLCNNFFYQFMTATHFQNVFFRLIVQIVWLDCFVAVIMTHYHLTPSSKVISNKLFLITHVHFVTYGGFQLRLNFGMINIHWMKKTFCSDSDIYTAILPNRETSTGDFGPKFPPKVFCSTTISSNQFMSPDDPWKVTDHQEQSPTTLETRHNWLLLLAETMLKVNKRSVPILM